MSFKWFKLFKRTRPDATEDTESNPMSSRKTSAKNAIANIQKMNDATDIKRYVQGDRRVGVQRTAKSRIARLPQPQRRTAQSNRDGHSF